MTSLLVGTLVISGVHTLAWLPRSLAVPQESQERPRAETGMYVRRFQPFHRNLHLMVIFQLLRAGADGHDAEVLLRGLGQGAGRACWAASKAAGLIHRFCAVLTFTYFGLHLYDLARQRRQSGKSWRQFITGPEACCSTAATGGSLSAR